MRIIVKTLSGLEEVLAKEVHELTGKEVEILKRAVAVEGDLETIYKLNYVCTTALRVLYELEGRQIGPDEKELYDFIYSIDWSEFLSLDKTFAIDAVVYSHEYSNPNYISLKVKDAIADQFTNKHGKRPDVDVKNADLYIHVHINSTNFVSVSLDSSGESLHRRGYKKRQLWAPLSEVLAAGILKISNWNLQDTIYDPMCGSGTIISEALISAAKIPARYKAPYFAFQKWDNYELGKWAKVKEQADQKIREPNCEILASDLTGKAVETALFNAKQLPHNECIDIRKRDFLDKGGPNKAKYIFMNPPYDKRMAFLNINEFYKAVGDKLKKDYTGTESWIITGNFEAMKHFGLRPSRKIPVFNGPMECKLYKFVMYSGSKKAKFQTSN